MATESALGHNLATERVEDVWGLVDDDHRVEEEPVVRRMVPSESAELDYLLLRWSLDPADVNHSLSLGQPFLVMPCERRPAFDSACVAGQANAES